MIELHRILVPSDFSETSAAALRYAVNLARQFNARLYLLHVPDYPGAATGDQLRELVTNDEAEALHVECAMRVGLPAEEIVRFALDHSADLVVMGTHGREGIDRLLLGSVAETVVRKAPCPVLTVHHPDRVCVPVREPVHGRNWAPA